MNYEILILTLINLIIFINFRYEKNKDKFFVVRLDIN
jgi:hypothetical protein